MASFDGGAFEPLAFDAGAFDLEDTPGALYGSAAGSGTASAALTAIAWIAGSAAGTSTAQAYLELDGAVPLPPTSGGARYPIPIKPLRRVRPREEDEAILLAVLH